MDNKINNNNQYNLLEIIKNIIISKKTQREIKFYLIVLGVFIFFAGHNFMQEFIMSLDGFKVNKLKNKII